MPRRARARSHDAAPAHPVGGAGGKRADLADLRLLRRAARCGFRIPAKAKREAVKQVIAILADAKAAARAKVAAARTLGTFELAELAAINTTLQARQQVLLVDAIRELREWRRESEQ